MTETTNNMVSKAGKLIIGDNLEVMRTQLLDNSIDLIYLDPPYNSKRNYFSPFDSDALKSKATFEDTWNYLEHQEATDKEFDRLMHNDDKLAHFLKIIQEGGVRDNNHFSYLTFMASRLIEMRRILKQNGTIYLHVDQTEGHYLKIVMDLVFGLDNFRNEIIWGYSGPSAAKKDFPRKHDIILRYSKTKDCYFNTDNIRIPYSEAFLKRRTYSEGKGGIMKNGKAHDVSKEFGGGKLPTDCWTDIPSGGQISSKERLGYPTQKPEALLERIISASCPPGGVMLDPFCGCGTSCAVAAKKGINYIGIDILANAEDVIVKRITDMGLIAPQIIGNSKDHYYHQKRMNRHLDLDDNEIIGSDRGIDGRGNFITTEGQLIKVVSQIKNTANVTASQVRDLGGVVANSGYDIGVFVMKASPTKSMRMFANECGYRFGVPRLQLLKMDDIESGQKIKLPVGAKRVRG